MEDHRFDGVTYLQPRDATYHFIRPTNPKGNHIPPICDVMLAVARDFSHVLIGGGFWGFDGLARMVDAIELEALAERFPHVPELRQVLNRTEATRGQCEENPQIDQRGVDGIVRSLEYEPRRRMRRVTLMSEVPPWAFVVTLFVLSVLASGLAIVLPMMWRR